MAEKTVYALTPAGEAEFRRLMLDLSDQPVHLFLDLNAVIVNLPGLPAGEREACLTRIGENVRELRASLEENLSRKGPLPEVPETGLAVLRQQLALAQSIETWLASMEGAFRDP